MKSNRWSGILAIVVMIGGACADAAIVAPEQENQELNVFAPLGAVQVAIHQDSVAADGSVTFVVRISSRDVPVSSYQGAVTFTPGAFELVSITAPTGRAGEAHVHNPATFADGRIRFAALTPTTFSGIDTGEGMEALRFTVRALRPDADTDLKAALDVVGGETGATMAPERILAAPRVLKSGARQAK